VVPLRLAITTAAAAAQVSREARRLARDLGFSSADAESVALAARELATNLVRYASEGEMVLSAQTEPRIGIRIECHDRGPGIANLQRAFEDGFSTGGGLGSGLPGARRLMDDFEIATGTGGTTIVASKWLTQR
jgi:serine/threonine-protein kinase RsbT